MRARAVRGLPRAVAASVLLPSRVVLASSADDALPCLALAARACVRACDYCRAQCTVLAAECCSGANGSLAAGDRPASC